jgi:hypothetical protein
MRVAALVVLLVLVALLVGCAKKVVDTGPPPPSDAAFAENSLENTLAWLATQKNALDAAGEKDRGEKFKAVAESMKGRSFAWTCRLAEYNSDGTWALAAHRIQRDPPEPPTEGPRVRYYALLCRPFEAGRPIPENDPFGRKLDVGFPVDPAGADRLRGARAGSVVRLSGTVAAAQLHSNSWVTGYGVKDRVVHTEIGITVHVEGGTISPP